MAKSAWNAGDCFLTKDRSGIVLVLELTMLPGFRTASIRSYIARLAARSSTMTSMIQSASLMRSSSSNEPVVISLAASGDMSGCGSAFFSFSSAPLARSSISRSNTGNPALARCAAMPAPMRPAPSTAQRWMSMAPFSMAYALSRMVAVPCPPPTHMVASAWRPPVRASRLAALPVMRAPEAPSGWPSAMAPPSRFTLA